MARSIKDISNGMKAEFVRNDNLRSAFGISTNVSEMTDDQLVSIYDGNLSAVNVVTLLIYIVAACAAAVENMLDWHIADVGNAIDNERYGQTGWYANVAKRFQYSPGTDFELNEATGEYGIVDEQYKIVSHASCENNGFGVKLKVAKESGDSLSPLTASEITAFESYMNRLKPAGIPVNVVSLNADTLKLDMAVYYDPTIFNGSGAMNKVVEVVREYLSDIDFNGEFVTMKMVDRLQSVPGLDIIEVQTVEAKHAGYEYSPIERNARYVPYAGYMDLDEDGSNIEIIANV